MPNDPFDALTDLFLGELSPAHAAAPREPSPAARVRTTPAVARGGAPLRQVPLTGAAIDRASVIEVVLCGHLPAMPGAWLSQYARNRADQAGAPVALIREGEGQLRIELHDPAGTPVRPAIRTNYAQGAVARAVRDCGTVLVAARTAAAAGRMRPKAITLLSGGDEAAIVHAYQCLKDLAASVGELGIGARLAVVVAGCSGAAAEQARRRLVDAAENFLGVSLEPGGVLARLESSRPGTTLYEGAFDGDLGALVLEAEMAPAPGPAAPPQTPAPAPHPVEPWYEEPRRAERCEGASNTPERTGLPLPRPRPETGVDAADAELGGPRLLDFLPGMTAVEFRCPSAPLVELGRDAGGRLHALARGAAQLSQLLAAAAWCEANSGLLARINAIDSAAPAPGGVVTHLFTDDRECLRTLSATGVRLHTLARAEVVVRQGWASCPVN